MKINIVIPTFNRRDSVKRLLESIRLQVISCNVHFETFLVVDGSTDGTLEMVKNTFPEVGIITGTGNWWFTKSLNEGIKASVVKNTDYILTLNDDLVIEKNYIQSLVEASKKLPEGSIIGSVSLTEGKPHRFFFSGVKTTNFNTYSARQYYSFMEEVNENKLTGIFPSTWVPTRGMFIPVSVLKKINQFDEKNFPQYGSDTDFCYRAAKTGSKIYVSYDSVVYSDWKKTGQGSPFIKQSLNSFLKNVFYNKYSSRYLGNNVRIIWRHFNKFMFPFLVLKVTLAKFSSYKKNQKIDA